MAASAIRSQLSLVNVGVACSTESARTGELQALVTADAFETCMLSLKVKSGLAVLEGRLRLHLPRFGGMACLAGPLDRAMRRRLCKNPLDHRSDQQQHP